MLSRIAGAGGPGRAATPVRPVSVGDPFANCTGAVVESSVPESAVEPRLAVDPHNPRHVVGVWQQDRFTDAEGGARGIVAGVSFNGGRTWRTVVIPGLTTCSGGTSYQRASDPWVSFAPHGVAYVSAVVFNPTAPDGSGGQSATVVSRSIAGGRAWSLPRPLLASTSPLSQADKDSVTADPHRPRLAYAAWEQLQVPPGLVGFQGPAYFSRTTDGGRTWSPAQVTFNPGPNAVTINHQILVAPDGTLNDLFTLFHASLGPTGVSFSSTLSLLQSSDHGRTWTGQPITAAPLEGIPVTDPNTGHLLRTSSTPSGVPAQFASVAIDPHNGHLYAVWQDARFSGGQYDSIAFAMSADGGRSWSTPVAINQTPTTIPAADRQAFDPTIAVAPDGTIAVTYYDFRNNAANAGPGASTDAWMVFSHPTALVSPADSSSWGGEVRLTDTSFNIEQAPVTAGLPLPASLGAVASLLSGGGYFLGDYQGLAPAGHSFLAFISQPLGSSPATVVVRRVLPRLAPRP